MSIDPSLELNQRIIAEKTEIEGCLFFKQKNK